MTHLPSSPTDDPIATQQQRRDGRVLLVGSDRDLRRFLCRALREEGFDVSDADSADRVIEEITAGGCVCIVLDDTPSRRAGAAALREFRAHSVTTPVLLLTVRDEPGASGRDIVAGADDYLARPLDLRELLALVRALVRGADARHQGGVLQTADLRLDRLTQRVTLSGRPIDLSRREFALLEFLMRNAGHTVSRACIAAAVWNRWFDSGTNVIDVYVSYLRKKLRGGRETVAIRAVRGVGYRLDVHGTHDP